MDKNNLRKKLIEVRRNIENRQQKEEDIATKFLTFFDANNFKSIFTYVSMDSEVDTKKIIHRIAEKCSIYVPFTKQEMISVELPKKLRLNADKYGNIEGMDGFLEKENSVSVFDKQCKDSCVIVPMLGFNSANYRIGYGKGFYDIFLKDCNAVSVGLAFDEQSIKFVQESHDVSLDIIMTPKNTYRV